MEQLGKLPFTLEELKSTEPVVKKLWERLRKAIAEKEDMNLLDVINDVIEDKGSPSEFYAVIFAAGSFLNEAKTVLYRTPEEQFIRDFLQKMEK